MMLIQGLTWSKDCVRVLVDKGGMMYKFMNIPINKREYQIQVLTWMKLSQMPEYKPTVWLIGNN